jgi:hypothetical protein
LGFSDSANLDLGEGSRENDRGKTSGGVQTGLIVGILLLIAIVGLVLLIVFIRRRKRVEELELSADGNELSFEVEERVMTEEELTFEDELSAGSQYANFSEFEASFGDPIADFQGTDGIEETLFGF